MTVTVDNPVQIGQWYFTTSKKGVVGFGDPCSRRMLPPLH